MYPWYVDFPVAQMVKNLPAVQKTRVRSLGQENPLEKGIAIHSSNLAWRIPWTEKPGRLQSMGLQRVGHDWVNNTHTHTHTPLIWCFWDVSVVKNLSANAGDVGSIPGSGTSSGEGNGNPFQYSCLRNPMHRRTWKAIVHGVAKELDTTKQLSMNAQTLDMMWWNSTLLPHQSHEPSLI